MRRLLWICIWTGSLLAQSVTSTTALDPPAEADALFLLTLGADDPEETDWSGSLSVEQGELARLSGYELRFGDLVHPPARWEARSQTGYQVPKRLMYEEYFRDVANGGVLGPSLLIYVRSTPATRVAARTAQGDFGFDVRAFDVGETQPLLGGRVRVARLPMAMLAGRGGTGAGERRTDNDFPSVAVDEGGGVWTVWQAYDGEADRVLAQRAGGPVLEAAGPGRDVYRTAAAFDGESKLWVVWSEQVRGDWDLYARAFDGETWTRMERLTGAAQPDAQHRLEAAPDGTLHLVWQGWREGVAGVFHKRYSPVEGWGPERRISAPDAENCWEPALAVTPHGDAVIAWDQYGPNGYDIRMRVLRGDELSGETAVAATPRFEAQVSAAADPEGRVWLAWHEAGVNWGKDFGYPRDITLPGEGLYQSREIRVAVWESGRLREPAQQLSEALPRDPDNFHELPELAVDGDGRVWCFFRRRTNYEINVPPRVPSHYALWEIQAASYDGERWSDAFLLPYSTGLNDQRMRAVRSQDGTVHAAWPTDRRDFRDFSTLLPDVFTAEMPRGDAAVSPRLVDAVARSAVAPPVHPNEAGDIERIRGYAYQLGDKRYRIFRGDLHRHTEFSWDGYNDGSLEDAYRYAIDAAGMDYLGVTEHATGAQHPYDWWRTQKAADLYRVGVRFTPLFAYERSAPYPNGHRNLIFSRRGVRDFDMQEHETGSYGDLRMGAGPLFAFLRREGGISTPHTTGSNMGTNWRDWGGDLEPLVEIYQSDRNNYEAVGAWRSADPDDKRTQHGGYRPDGMVSVAWEKGYRMGVQASSDHMGTHAAYAMILAERNTREGLLEAMRARHAYAATDNIIVDFRLVDGEREYLMGDEATVAGPPLFRLRLVGTAPIGEVEIVKNNAVVYAARPGTATVELEYRDNEPAGEEAAFYYVRLRQTDQDRQLAWSSPIWVAGR